MSSRPSAQSRLTNCHCRKYGSSCGGCLPPCWNTRKLGPSFQRVVCFKFLRGVSSITPIVGFYTALQITTQTPRNKWFLQRSPPRPWIRGRDLTCAISGGPTPPPTDGASLLPIFLTPGTGTAIKQHVRCEPGSCCGHGFFGRLIPVQIHDHAQRGGGYKSFG